MGFLAAIPALIAAAGTVSTALTGTTLLAAGVSAAGAAVSAYSQYKTDQFQAAVANNNATIAKNNANTALNEGTVAASLSKERTSKLIGTELAGQGANGVDVAFGSPARVREGTQQVGDLDALTIQYNASAKALAYSQQSAGYTSEAKADKMAGNNAILSGAIGVGSSLIGGAQGLSKIAYARAQGTI